MGVNMSKPRFPFMAIMGQEELSLALILNLINPQIGGVLIRGTKGTGKSTAVYGLPQIAPTIKVHSSCNYNCAPDEPETWCDFCKAQPALEVIEKEIEVVNLPMNISEENLFGKIDIEKLLKTAEKAFVPGLIAKANRQILYIDEVNLIPDHITDSLLDVVASGVNIVEREGFSISHPGKFLLIGTMNSEEGELRPQILDRFPLSVTIFTVNNVEDREEIIRRNFAYEADPAVFVEGFAEINDMMTNSILAARKLFPQTTISQELVQKIIQFCIQFAIDGHRSEIVIVKTARTYAALELKQQVEIKHIKMAMKLTLLHRTREGGLKKPVTWSDIETWFEGVAAEQESAQTFSLQYNPANISLLKGGFVTPSKKSEKALPI
jgi:Mg-chelatase subunit ChlI